jgi:carbohydrate kinase (thermoresistant glucokinase family)
LNRLLARHLQSTGAVLACSALKQAYRDQLQAGLSGVVFVYLQGAFELIHQRLLERAGHFMQAPLLRSQFDALEEPENAIVVSAQASVDQQVAMVLSELARR